MNGYDLSNILKSFSHVHKRFWGIVPEHYLPKAKIWNESLIVVNTRNHWICIYIPPNPYEPLEYFDSLGNPPTPFVKQFIHRQHRKYIFNTRKVQGKTSISCGSFCILFSVLRLAGLRFHSIVRLFTTSHLRNDQMVNYFVKSFT